MAAQSDTAAADEGTQRDQRGGLLQPAAAAAGGGSAAGDARDAVATSAAALAPPSVSGGTKLRRGDSQKKLSSAGGAKKLASRRIHRALSLLPRRKTLVLDMDETLIHCLRDFTRAPRRCDFVAEVAAGVGPTDGFTLYHIYKRPHVDLFLKTVHQWYTVVVFTAAVKDYANPILDQLDPNGELFDKRLFREHCTTVAESTYKKGLEQIEPDLRDVCIVDNNDASFVTPENGIPISDYLGGAEDEALSELIPFLDALRFTDDVRNVLSLRLVG